MRAPRKPSAAAIVVMGVVAAILAAEQTRASAPSDVGSVEKVLRSAYGTPPLAARRAKNPGDGVVFKELLETYPDSAAQVKFIDGSELTLGARASVVLDEFVFNPANSASHNYMSLSAGALRFVTGAMPKGKTVIDTPTATLTLRGTNIRVVVGPDGSTELIVDDGSVDTHSKGSNSDETVGAGDSVTITQQGFQNGDPSDTGDPVVDDGFPYNTGDIGTVEQRRGGSQTTSGGGEAPHSSGGSSSSNPSGSRSN